MCFQMIYRTDYVDTPDEKTKFEVIDAGGPKPTLGQMEAHVKMASKIWVANHVVGKAIQVAEASGRVQEVSRPGDIPELWDRGLLFTNKVPWRFMPGIAHPETAWIDLDVRLSNRVLFLQLKDFSFAAQVSFGEFRDDPEPMGENVLIRRECRIKFGLEASDAIIYQLPEGWEDVEMAKHYPNR